MRRQQCNTFLLFQSSKPQKQVWILIERTDLTEDLKYLKRDYDGYRAYIYGQLIMLAPLSSLVLKYQKLSFIKAFLLDLLPTISCFWQVIFEGVVGSSYTGDIAIDDFSLKAGSCFYGEYWIIAHQSPILSTGRPPSVRVAVFGNEHRYFVYLINTDSIKSKCLHNNSTIGRLKKP